MREPRRPAWYVGKELSNSIFLEEILRNNRADKKFRLRCRVCGKSVDKWTSQINKGEWEVCEHDLD